MAVVDAQAANNQFLVYWGDRLQRVNARIDEEEARPPAERDAALIASLKESRDTYQRSYDAVRRRQYMRSNGEEPPPQDRDDYVPAPDNTHRSRPDDERARREAAARKKRDLDAHVRWLEEQRNRSWKVRLAKFARGLFNFVLFLIGVIFLFLEVFCEMVVDAYRAYQELATMYARYSAYRARRKSKRKGRKMKPKRSRPVKRSRRAKRVPSRKKR